MTSLQPTHKDWICLFCNSEDLHCRPSANSNFTLFIYYPNREDDTYDHKNTQFCEILPVVHEPDPENLHIITT